MGERVEIVPGVAGPAVLEHELTLTTGGQRVSMSIAFDATIRRYVCDQLTVRRGGGAPVTTEALRVVQVARHVSAALLIGPGIEDLPNPDGVEPWGRSVPDGIAE